MLIQVLVETVVALGLLWLLSTQILIPLWQNKPLFTLFRKERRLHAELREINQQKAEQDLADIVDLERAILRRKPQPKKEDDSGVSGSQQ